MSYPPANKTPFGPNESPITAEHSPILNLETTNLIVDPVERDAHQIDLSNSKVAEHPEPVIGDHPHYESPRILN